MISYFPSYISKRSILIYILALLVISVIFLEYTMPWYWCTLGIVSVFLFFYCSNYLSISWSRDDDRIFEKKVFWTTVFTRLAWIVLYYFLTTTLWNTPWEQPIGTTMDSYGYYGEAEWILSLLSEKRLSTYCRYISTVGDISDMGYPVFLAIVGLFTKNSIFCTRIPNAFFDAWAAVMIFRLAARNFDKPTARIASIFMMLMPLSFFFSATTLKESLMLMLTIWCMNKGDLLIRQKTVNYKTLFSFAALAGALFLFRTVLGIVVVLSMACAFVLTSNKILKKNKKVQGILVGGIMGLMVFGGSVSQMVEGLSEDLEHTESNFEYRATMKGGNSLVSNMKKSYYIPIIFTVPFPTMVNIESQQAQQTQHGGDYIKNILSFFCILGMILLLKNKEWKGSVLIMAFLVGYLAVLCFSAFAHSSRFHMPAIPFEIIFASYGITHFTQQKYKNIFSIFLLVELIVIIGWNWFKLKGRGMV